MCHLVPVVSLVSICSACGVCSARWLVPLVSLVLFEIIHVSLRSYPGFCSETLPRGAKAVIIESMLHVNTYGVQGTILYKYKYMCVYISIWKYWKTCDLKVECVCVGGGWGDVPLKLKVNGDLIGSKTLSFKPEF